MLLLGDGGPQAHHDGEVRNLQQKQVGISENCHLWIRAKLSFRQLLKATQILSLVLLISIPRHDAAVKSMMLKYDYFDLLGLHKK